MTFPGKDAGAEPPVDPKLGKALSHPLRQRILERLNAEGEASPKQLARAFDASLPTVAYHMQVLRELEFVELARTRHVRGALEHYYRATAHPWFDLDQWAKLPASFRSQASAQALRDIVADASDAGVAGGFDDPEALVRRLALQLDDQGWQEVAALLEQTLTSLRKIHAASTGRTPDVNAHPDSVDAEVAVLLFRRARVTT